MHLPSLFAAVYVSLHCMDPPRLYATLSETHTHTMAWHGMAWHGPLCCLRNSHCAMHAIAVVPADAVETGRSAQTGRPGLRQ